MTLVLFSMLEYTHVVSIELYCNRADDSLAASLNDAEITSKLVN